MGRGGSFLLSLVSVALLGVQAAALKQDCYGATVKISAIHAQHPDEPVLEVYGYPSAIGRAIPASPTGSMHLELAAPPHACAAVSPPALPLSAALVSRGECDFVQKALALAAAGYSAMILVDSAPGCVFMSANDTAAAGALEIQAATITAVAGRRDSDSEAEGPRARADPGFVVSRVGAGGFVVVASTLLLLFYYLDDDWLASLLTFVFMAACWSPLAEALAAAVELALWRAPRLRASLNDPASLPLLGPVGLLQAVSVVATVTTIEVWREHRDAGWAWAVQDAMGAALLVSLLRTVRLPDLATACILLPLAFLYDVWWVFLQPLVTGGPSVMGDVALPGLLVVLTWRWDVTQRFLGVRPSHYGPCALAGYAVGLTATYAALRVGLFGDAGQPALLYLVPSTLGTTCALAAARSELGRLWTADVDPESLRSGGGPAGEDVEQGREALLAT
ncbi:Signal peptide peptidase-like 2B [Auxenochlorella protothecoides]|uniref:Signal peptide peptidase-like 2B n=1 Tax=Auxenochlorella protothecoides TaxID=3075 RepID=A0A087SNT2_AUXPR|nr:Signal peptide peptidase-like 2B [Auxenochlorella protothecoides]KFM27386.1 Signal peptide peptidase-like 2B [Auxenochlorella protothecoides]